MIYHYIRHYYCCIDFKLNKLRSLLGKSLLGETAIERLFVKSGKQKRFNIKQYININNINSFRKNQSERKDMVLYSGVDIQSKISKYTTEWSP